jgi:nucleotide-binding universal stress UspA family protein
MKVNMQRILCPIDFSESADHALRYAAALAETFSAELTLLHVVAPVVAALPGDTTLPDTLQADIDDLAEACRERLEQTVGKMAANGVPVQHKILNGVPFVEIIRYARESETDLIVMGTHGRTGLGHLLIGSVAERVVRKSPCPVLTVKHPEHEFVLP